MMIAREADDGTTTTKQEGNNNTAADNEKNNINISKASSSSTSLSSSWSRLKDPRIVRVSRAFGGKDRHSKVCTVRGLRDRRVRLSVPTAIQLYDLQDRLGLNQPSKVVDWLLNAAKHEIDELPPLQMPPGGNFSQNLQPPPAVASASQSSRGLIKIGNSSSINWDDHHHPTDVPSGSNNTWNKAKEAAAARDHQSTNDDDKEITWTRRNHEEEKQSQFEDINHGVYVSSSNNFFSRHSTHSSTHGLGNLLNNSGQPNYGSLVRWDPSTLSLAQSGSPGLTVLPQPSEDFHNFNVVSLASGANPQVLVYHQPPGGGGGSGGIAQSYFPSQINFQMMLNSNSDHNSLTPPTNDDSGSQQGRPFHLMTTTTTTTTNFLPMQKERGNE